MTWACWTYRNDMAIVVVNRATSLHVLIAVCESEGGLLQLRKDQTTNANNESGDQKPMFDQIWEGRLHWVGTIIPRSGMAFIFLRFGIYKFMPPGVTGVEVWTAHTVVAFDKPAFGTQR